MKKLFAALLLCFVVCGTICAEADIRVDGVTFEGFGVDGKIKLDDATFGAFQGVYLRNSTREKKSVYVTLQISGYSYREGVVATLEPNSLTKVVFPLPPSNYLRSDYVTVIQYSR